MYQPGFTQRNGRCPREANAPLDRPSPLLVANTVWLAVVIGQERVFPACVLPARTAGLVVQALRAEGGARG